MEFTQVPIQMVLSVQTVAEGEAAVTGGCQ
jgi:hypothetical protein